MTPIKSIVVIAVVAYLAMLAALFILQRGMMYFPDSSRIAPAAAGFAQASEHRVAAKDGENIILWYAPPRSGRSLILYFQGNGGHIAGRVFRFRQLMQDGDGILAVSYRGYGGSSGSPSEAGLIEDARAAYAFARGKGHAPETIILFGESIGSGVASALAAEQETGGLILEAPFTSATAVAATLYWMFPVRWLLRDTFRSDRRMARIRSPKLFLHGDADPVIPLHFGQKLFEMANEPKQFLVVKGGGHQVLELPQMLAAVRSWLQERALR